MTSKKSQVRIAAELSLELQPLIKEETKARQTSQFETLDAVTVDNDSEQRASHPRPRGNVSAAGRVWNTPQTP